jgi:hypothetical protein
MHKSVNPPAIFVLIFMLFPFGFHPVNHDGADDEAFLRAGLRTGAKRDCNYCVTRHRRAG